VGLMDDLGYEAKSPNRLQQVMQRLGSTRLSGRILSKTLYPMDRALFKATGGRTTVSGVLGGLAVIMLTTTGAKSGKLRTMPLIGIPLGNDLAIIGTNYGQESTPGWVYNLEASPAAAVGYRDKIVAVTARRADESETDRAFDLAAAVLTAYAEYRLRADHRAIRAFVLQSTA